MQETVLHAMALTPRCCCYSKTPLLLWVLMLTVWEAACGQLRYSIPEEMEKGSFVGNVALDLGMDRTQLSDGGVRIVSRGRKQYFVLNLNNGHLYINDRIDREEMCAQLIACVLSIEIIAEGMMKVFAVEIEIKDVNDNSPTFIPDQIVLQVIESTAPGTRFALPDAHDADMGINYLQSYQLSPNPHFRLDIKTEADGKKYGELVLEKPLDREEQTVHQLILTSTDGGDPVRTGTAHIRVVVVDANDNAPVFRQSVYKIGVLENMPKGSVVGTITATDADEGTHSELTYSFNKITEKVLQKFKLDSKTGELSVIGNLDFEESELYEFEVRGTDGGSLSSRCKVLLEVINVNDNSPELLISSLLKQVTESSPPGTVIALLQVYDRDSGENGEVTCFIPSHLPFQLKKSFGSYYSLVTDGALDREQASEYNITITAADKGAPPLFKTETINVQISDENDNPPVFEQIFYTTYVMENLSPGASIFSAEATDRDWGQNAKITYSVIEGHIRGVPLMSYISMNSESGIMYALHSFDFEQLKEFQVEVKAQDCGSPVLTSNATVRFIILDQNDNTPEILYPSNPTDGSTGGELAPPSSGPGYLITKVVAVDADSGQNAWLSYQLLKASDQGLFTVGLHTGEIKTARLIMEKDALIQTLVVLVKDNGHIPLSSSVTVTIVLADSVPEMFPDISSPSATADMESNLTFYLVIAVAVVSFLFLFLIILLLAIRLHQWRESQLFQSNKATLESVPASQFVGIDGVRAFLQTYSHDVCLTTNSGKSQCMFPNSSHSNTLSENQNVKSQGTFLVEDLLNLSKEVQPFTQVS